MDDDTESDTDVEENEWDKGSDHEASVSCVINVAMGARTMAGSFLCHRLVLIHHFS